MTAALCMRQKMSPWQSCYQHERTKVQKIPESNSREWQIDNDNDKRNVAKTSSCFDTLFHFALSGYRLFLFVSFFSFSFLLFSFFPPFLSVFRNFLLILFFLLDCLSAFLYVCLPLAPHFCFFLYRPQSTVIYVYTKNADCEWYSLHVCTQTLLSDFYFCSDYFFSSSFLVVVGVFFFFFYNNFF